MINAANDVSQTIGRIRPARVSGVSRKRGCEGPSPRFSFSPAPAGSGRPTQRQPHPE